MFYKGMNTFLSLNSLNFYSVSQKIRLGFWAEQLACTAWNLVSAINYVFSLFFLSFFSLHGLLFFQKGLSTGQCPGF